MTRSTQSSTLERFRPPPISIHDFVTHVHPFLNAHKQGISQCEDEVERSVKVATRAVSGRLMVTYGKKTVNADEFEVCDVTISSLDYLSETLEVFFSSFVLDEIKSPPPLPRFFLFIRKVAVVNK